MPQQRTNPYLALMEIPPGYLNIMGYLDESQVNGPGCRAVIWVQGCLQECPSCYDPSSWSFDIRELMSVEQLARKVTSNPRHTGVTFSGGEPFWQAPALAELARQIKAAGLDIMCFTGFTLERLQSAYAPAGTEELLEQLDLLVDRPCQESQSINNADSLVSSRNQRVHVFNPALRDQLDWASDQIETYIMKDGTRIFTSLRQW